MTSSNVWVLARSGCFGPTGPYFFPHEVGVNVDGKRTGEIQLVRATRLHVLAQVAFQCVQDGRGCKCGEHLVFAAEQPTRTLARSLSPRRHRC